ncbi:MAG: HesA/MoeB/ThiF family protein [Spirochaetaceae bacterium]
MPHGAPGASQFSRHLDLIGPEGVERLAAAKVAVIGAGGLGSTVLELLVRLGVGEILVYDHGIVDLPDLNRQILYSHDDLRRPKAEAAADYLRRINPEARIRAVAETVEPGFFFSTDDRAPDAVVDCLDNFATRFVVDDACFAAAIPLVHGGVYRHFGQVTVVRSGITPSLKEIFGEQQKALDEEANKPMFPPAVVGVATVEATESAKLLLRRPPEEILYNRLLSIDYSDYTFQEIPLAP